MNICSKSAFICLVFTTGLALSVTALGAPIDVSYTVSGSSGDWNLNFSVVNNLNPSDMDVYLFGVDLSAPNVVDSPAGFDPTLYSTWNNQSLGGSDISYNNVWTDLSLSNLEPGQTVSDFTVNVTDAAAPSAVPWFAIAYSLSGGNYSGYGNFDGSANPAFEGTADVVPEPESYALLALGAGCMAFAARGRRNSM